VNRGQTAELWYDTSKMCIFDTDTGINIVEGDKTQKATSDDPHGAPSLKK
jgi:hypothetical protein